MDARFISDSVEYWLEERAINYTDSPIKMPFPTLLQRRPAQRRELTDKARYATFSEPAADVRRAHGYLLAALLGRLSSALFAELRARVLPLPFKCSPLFAGVVAAVVAVFFLSALVCAGCGSQGCTARARIAGSNRE